MARVRSDKRCDCSVRVIACAAVSRPSRARCSRVSRACTEVAVKMPVVKMKAAKKRWRKDSLDKVSAFGSVSTGEKAHGTLSFHSQTPPTRKWWILQHCRFSVRQQGLGGGARILLVQ